MQYNLVITILTYYHSLQHFTLNKNSSTETKLHIF